MALINRIAIYGKSGHGKVIADIARLCGYDEIIYIDDDMSKDDVISYESFKEAYKEACKEIDMIVAIGNNSVRAKIFAQLSLDGFSHATLIHPSAIISPSAFIDEGSVVMANVVVNADAKVGKGVILNTACVIEHDNIIEDFVHISPRVALAGNVKVGELSHMGIGSCTIQGVTIGKNSVVGAGSIVKFDVEDNIVAYDVPLRKKKENN